jgi:drug/metabolite transporter (DMT)-like permease
MASAAQWLSGGTIGLLVAVLFEPATHAWQIGQTSAASWGAWLYLVVMGTLVTLNAYLWLLKNSSAALASSYSFVNPVVALWVGVALGGEMLTGQVFIALPLILLALALIVYGQHLWRWLGPWVQRRTRTGRHAASS